MTIEEKIEEARKLSLHLNQLKNFKKLLEKSGVDSEINKEEFNHFNYLKVSSRIWTGSQTADYHEEIYNDEAMIEIKTAIIPIIDKNIERIEKEINLIIK